jgi:hypothetical protein
LCAATLLQAGAEMTERTPIAHLIDEIRESGGENRRAMTQGDYRGDDAGALC